MSRPRLLVVPGLGLGPRSWAPTTRVLDADTDVLTLPGYGVRARRDEPLSPRALADRVVEGLPDATPLVLAGHSASCQVVAHVAGAASDRVAGLVLVGPTTDPATRTWPALARRWLRTARYEDPRQVPGLVRQYARTGPVSMARGMDAARRDRLEHTLERLACPVLVVRGRHDAICDASWARTVGGLAPSGSRAVSLPAGGHMVPSTHGPLVAAEVARLLQEVE